MAAPLTLVPWLVRATSLAIIVVAFSAFSACTGSDGDSTLPNRTPEPTETPAIASVPTATPVPTPTVTPEPIPRLQAPEPRPGSGLFDLRTDMEVEWPVTGVTVDGTLRAVSAVGEDRRLAATVWIPGGPHDICVGGVPAGSLPVFWDAGTEPSPPEPLPESSGPERSGDDPTTAPTATAAPVPTPTPLPTPTPVPLQMDSPTCAEASGIVASPPTLFPGHRVVAHYGTGITSALGILGEGPVDVATERLTAAAAEYEGFDLPVVPAFEFIATVAQGSAGSDGTFSIARPTSEITEYLAAAREVDGLVFLDLQPGRSSFSDQLELYASLLREPDVHLALDPEWSMRPDQTPGRSIGSISAETVNEILETLQRFVIEHGLPQKVLIVHQFQIAMVRDRALIEDPPGIAVMFHVDGQGPVGAKYGTYDALSVSPPFFNGFKVFFDEDSRVMTPTEVVELNPPPVYVSYQ